MGNELAVTNRGIRYFEKLGNFRDIGGLATQDGRMMRTGVLFRSDEPSILKLKDWDKFSELKFKLICDLRTPNERKSKIIRISDSRVTRIINVPIYQNDHDYTGFEFFKLMMTSARTIDFYPMMKQFYRRIVFESTDQIRTIFTMISEEAEGPVLIHCTGGKDRTGIVAAFIQLLVGIPRQEVVSDYLLSNTLNEYRMAQLTRLLRFMSLFRLSKERLKPLLDVRREYLEEVLDELYRQYGTIDAYLADACGIQEQTIKRFKDNLQ